jgi:Kef-type K+ transport system, predicted NAD-binding component
MLHHTPLIATIAVGFLVAFILGLVASRFKLSPIVGYLLAGVLVGPFTPGFTADSKLAAELAEIGVILLMFGVGLHFSYRDLFAVKNIALPGAVAQIAVATLLGMGLAWVMGWPIAGGLIFGLALSVASTVVLLRALEERQLLDTRSGHIAVGWLIVEDLAMVVALVLLPVLATTLPGGDGAASAQASAGGSLGASLAITFGKVAAFVALMFVVGRRVIPWLLARVAGVGSRELFTLAVLAIGIGIAYGAAVLFDVSFALGAFFAGMILKESELSHKAADDTLPLRDAFAVLFFVSVGMLFNPMVLVEKPLAVLATLAIILVGKSAAAFFIVRAFRYPSDTAVLIAASLAQVGEFSFILVTLGLSLGVLPETGRDLVLGGSILSIVLNPTVFAIAGRLRAMRLRRLSAKTGGEAPSDVASPYQTACSDHVIVIGFGRVGKRVAEHLIRQGESTVIIESDINRVEDLRQVGQSAIHGNAARTEVLEAAGVRRARSLLVAVPNGFEAGEIVARARAMNPGLRIVARAHLDAEVEHLKANGADRVIMGEQEIARLMISDVGEEAAPAAA